MKEYSKEEIQAMQRQQTLGIQHFRRIKALLREWDPIGVLHDDSDWPDDEYDGYAGEVYQLLKDNADSKKIAKHLENICQKRMGIECNNPRTKTVAEKLSTFWQQAEKNIKVTVTKTGDRHRE